MRHSLVAKKSLMNPSQYFFSHRARSFVTPNSNHRIGAHAWRESDRTLRDGSFGWRCPRHFVPGYDRTVPPGQKPFAHSKGLALSWAFGVETLG
jgi:hypothetical protein